MGLGRHLGRRARRVANAILRQPVRGADLYQDLALLGEARMVFDVGANLGQSAVRYLREFPASQVFSFEPVASTFDSLTARLGRNKRLRPFRIALGSRSGAARMDTTEGPSDTFQLRADGNEEVGITTLDRFCQDHGIDRIDFIKIDTEGHDLDVLKGAAGMLGQHRIGAIQIEAGMNPENDRHAPFETMKTFLEGLGYRIFGFYDQVDEFPTRELHLRRTNPVFIPRMPR